MLVAKLAAALASALRNLYQAVVYAVGIFGIAQAIWRVARS